MDTRNPETSNPKGKTKMKKTDKEKMAIASKEKKQEEHSSGPKTEGKTKANNKLTQNKKTPKDKVESKTKEECSKEGQHRLSQTFKKAADEVTNNVRKHRKSEDLSGRRLLPTLDISHTNGKRKFSIVLRERPHTSLPALYGASSRSSKNTEEPRTKKVPPPLRRTNTLTRMLAFRRMARNMASNLESRKQAIPSRDKISKDYWRKAKVWSKLEQKKEMMLPKQLKKFVYRTGKTWKLRATAFIGEPGRLDPNFDPVTGRVKMKSLIQELVEEPEDGTKPLTRFRHAVKTIQFLLKATVSTRQEGARSEAKLLSFAQYQDEVENTTNKGALYGDGLSFDPHEFKAVRQVQLSVEAKTVLRMEPMERTEEHIRLVLVSLQQAVQAFSEFPIKMQKSLVKVGWYEKFQTKRVIIRQGHKAENFYFIISGTAVVTILVTEPQTGHQFVRTAAFLGKGNSFGELGLMHGSHRSATVTCKEEVELLTVGREDFIDIFMHIERDREPEHIQFLKTIDVLHGWPIQKIPWDDPKICLFTYFRRGVVMCKDSSQAEWIYFIKTGSCRVLMSLKATRPRLTATTTYPATKRGKDQTKDPAKDLPKNSKCIRLQQGQTPCKGVKDKQQPFIKKTGVNLPPVACGAMKVTSGQEERVGEETRLIDTPSSDTSRDAESLSSSDEDHNAAINVLFEERHPISLFQGDYMTGPDKLKPVVEEEEENRKPHLVFVQIQKLGPKDTFGVGEAAFSLLQSTMSMSLVSDGAEAVLISRKFFLQHLGDEKRRQLRTTLRPYPTEESLQEKLQDQTNWDAFKALTLREHVDYARYVHDTLNWYEL